MPAWDLRSAFPTSLALPAARVIARLGAAAAMPAVDGARVVVDGESLTIPARIYLDPSCVQEGPALPEVEQLMLMCLFTRHHDGHVRERCLRAIVDRSEPWVAPFVVQLLGEYVLEIVEVIRSKLSMLAPAS